MRTDVVPQAGGVRPAPRSIPTGLLLAVAACGGTAHQLTIEPPPPRDTHAVLAGGLCADNRCTCRGEDGAGEVGVPDTADKKRFEIRIGPSPHELWVSINKTTVLYKSAERVEACFYVDLPTGAQHVELRASNPEGVSAALQIHELGTRTRSWYDTFAFSCGAPGPCSFDALEAEKAQYAKASRSMFDPCGTTKVKGISWDHGKAPDQQHPSELVVRLTLDIYKFAAWKPSGDPTCGKGGGRGGPPDSPGSPGLDDEPAAPPAETP